MEVKESKGVDERYERMARDILDKLPFLHLVKDEQMVALALERAAVEREAQVWTQAGDAADLPEYRSLRKFFYEKSAALRKRLEELKEGGR